MSNSARELRRQKMITEPILPLLVKTALPTMIGMMIMTIYNLTDTFWIGMLNDSSMTAAIGIVFAYVSLVQAVGFWFGYGSGNVMSRELGAREEEEAEIYANTGVVLSLIAGIIMLVPSMIFLKQLALLLGGGAGENLLANTMSYLRIMLLAVPFSLFSTTVYNQLRLCGNVKDAMLGMMTGIAANIILDPVFVLAFHMEIAGAGLATLIGQAGSSLSLVILSLRHGNIPVGIRKCDLSKDRVFQILAGGSPNFTRQGITSLASVLMNSAASCYGETLIAALTVANRVAAIGYMLAIGFGQGFQPICAMNYGAKKYKRVMTALKYTLVTGTCMMIISAVLYAVFARQLISVFTSDPDVIMHAVRILKWQCTAMPVLAVYAYASMYMQNTGHYFRALIISVMRQGLIFIPLLLVLPGVMGVSGFYILQPASDFISAFASSVIILQYWKQSPDETGSAE